MALVRKDASLVASAVRMTEDSEEYKQAFQAAHIDTNAFDNCTKLKGTSNFVEWTDDLKLCARKVGLRSLLTGMETAPERPAEGVSSTSRWNDLMLLQAHWFGKNDSALGYLQSTLEPHLRARVEDCTLVSEALKILDDACPPPSIFTAAEKLRIITSYSLNKASSFPEFRNEFEKRVLDFNRLRGHKAMPDQQVLLLFLNALGPRLRKDIEAAARASERKTTEMSTAELCKQAESLWCSNNNQQSSIVSTTPEKRSRPTEGSQFFKPESFPMASFEAPERQELQRSESGEVQKRRKVEKMSTRYNQIEREDSLHKQVKYSHTIWHP